MNSRTPRQVRKFFAFCSIVWILSQTGTLCVSQTGAPPSTYQFNQSKTVAPEVAERFIFAGQNKLHYVECGSGRPLVMIHGNAGDLRDFEFQTLALLAHNYRAIAFDLPGHGLSKMPDKAKGTIHEQAVILHQAITALGIKNPILVGHSWGGAVVLAYALLYPEETSALVLLAPAAYSDNRNDAPAAYLLHLPLLSDICIAMLKPILGRRLLRKSLAEAFAPDPVPDDYFQAAANVWLDRKRLKAFIKEDLVLGSSLKKMSRQYPMIRRPVIIVTGDSDMSVSPQQNAFALHKAIANSTLIVIPHSGHEIPETHPEAVLRAVDMAALDSPIPLSSSRH